ncbi:S41 family peptidase [Bacteroidota bacterium]
MVKIKLFIIAIAAILLPGCEDIFVDPADSNLNIEDFEATWERVNTVYPYLDYKQINWDSIYLVYRPQAEQVRGDEIYTVLIEMLTELKDMHIHVKTDGGRYMSTYLMPRWIKDKYAYDPLVVRNYFDKELIITGEGTIEYEIIDGNIGYIYMGTFDDDYLLNYFSEALEYVRNTESLILDIRHNNGGSYQNLVAVVSRFITSPLEKPGYYLLGEQIQLTPFESQGNFQYTKPVVLLINGVCYSTGDIFPEVMKQISTVTLVGDTTGGGSSGSTTSAPALYKLPSGKTIFVGTTDWRRYDGTPLEWVGVEPDILVPQTNKDIENGIDKQLEYAIDFLN